MGFLRNTLGLAEAARLYVEALSGGGLPVSTTAISADLPVDPATGKTVKRTDQPYEDRRAAAAPVFNLACMNGDHLTHLVRAAGEQILGGRPTIGHWAWETDVVPPSWFEGFKYVEEIWVNSTFVAENLGRVAPVPVVVVPQAVVVPEPAGVELPVARDGRFTFLFMLDFFSTLRRKNALGLVDAFTRAFRPGEGPRLLLKTINAQFRRQERDELSSRIADRPDIELIDGVLDPLQKTALVARADCYVSLHRSEGFGLTLAESMALGTPVIATGYSGNMDFTTPQNSYLVDWTPTLVGPDCDIYPHDGRWAEPDLDHAAELMRRVWARQDEARAKAERARVDIERLYAPRVVGRVARARLELLSARGSALATDPARTAALVAVDRELGFDLRRGGAPTPAGAAGVLRRAVLRLMMPFTVHERILDRALADGLRELRVDLNHKRLQGVRLRARLRRLEGRLAVEAQADDAPGEAEAPARSATIA
jgi:Glycosyl transferases group 1